MQITRDYCEGMIEGFGYNPLTGKIYDKYVTFERKVLVGKNKPRSPLSVKRNRDRTTHQNRFSLKQLIIVGGVH